MVFSEGSIDEVIGILARELDVPKESVNYETIDYKNHEHHIFSHCDRVYTYFAIQAGSRNGVDEFYLGIFMGHLKTKDAVVILADNHENDRHSMGELDPLDMDALKRKLLNGRLHRVIIGLDGKGQ